MQHIIEDGGAKNFGLGFNYTQPPEKERIWILNIFEAQCFSFFFISYFLKHVQCSLILKIGCGTVGRVHTSIQIPEALIYG